MKQLKNINWKDLGVILALAAGLLSLIAFFLMFASPLVTDNVIGNGKTEMSFGDAFFGTDNTKGAVIGFIGFLLYIVAAAGAVVSVFLDNEKIAHMVRGAGKLVAILAVIFVFSTKSAYFSANDITNANAQSYFHLNVGTIVGGILGILSAVCSAASLVLPKVLKK